MTATLSKVVAFSTLDRWDATQSSVAVAYLWPTVTLGEVAEVRLGTQVPKKGSVQKGEETPYLRAANVQRGHFNLSDLKTMVVPQATIDRLEVQANDILFVEGNSHEEVGRSAVWPDGYLTTTIIQNSVVRVRLSTSNLLPDFVSTWFNSEAGSAYIREQATTTSGSLWHIGAGKLAAAPLPVPPLDVQAQIVADYRTRLDEAEQAQRDGLATKDDAWKQFETALVDLPTEAAGGSGIVSVTKFSSLDRWDVEAAATAFTSTYVVEQLGDVSQVRLGVQVPRKSSKLSGHDHPYLRSMNVRRGNLDLSDVKTMNVSPRQAAQILLNQGDVLFVEGSGSVKEVGRAAVWDGSIANVIHQNSVVRARFHDDRLDSDYVATWFNCPAGNAYIREQATTTSGLYHIGAGKLAGAPVPIPPLDIQRELVARLRESLQESDGILARVNGIKADAEASLRRALVRF